MNPSVRPKVGLLALTLELYETLVPELRAAREAWLRLTYLNFHHIFDHVVTFDDTGERKPNAAPFKRVLELLGVQGHEALMIGDWEERDVVGAAKEAMSKALATGWAGDFQWKNVEVVNALSGKPEIVLHGRTKETVAGNAIHLTISLSDTSVVAFVVIESTLKD